MVLSDGECAGQTVKTALLPFTLDGQRLPVRLDPPRLGQHSRALLAGVGYDDAAIDGLFARRLVA